MLGVVPRVVFRVVRCGVHDVVHELDGGELVPVWCWVLGMLVGVWF